MHERPRNPPDHVPPAPFFPCRPTVKHRSHSLQRKDPRSCVKSSRRSAILTLLMAYGRCLRPALYSSLRSSPSHPTGVSALRVTIAIANVRFARQQWELRKSTAKSLAFFRNESATSQRVRAVAIGGSTA